jgi:hypothetical protein
MRKKFIPFLVAFFVLAIFSCQKETTLAENKNDEPVSLRNGGGPYVLNMLIELSGANEVPPVNTTATGTAHLRLTEDRVLYSKVIVEDLEAGDALRFSHVHSGAAGVNGPISIFLCHTADDFGKNMVINLTEAQYDLLVNGACYVNAHSNFRPGGLVRGQIR